jgi:hypothetical protein
MTTKKPKAKAALSKSEKHNQFTQAKMLNSASAMSAINSEAFSKGMFPDLDISELIGDLRTKIEKVQSGDMQAMEAMLVGQAQSLQTIFVSLARKASSQEYLKNYGMFMNLALKAQSQSRATIQALTELKYPKQATFVKQANISSGHQQVNNGSYQNSTHAPAHAKETINQPNELLEVSNGSQNMDSGTAQTTITQDKAMATVETKYRG